jgi:ABC-type glycerol-3-phosphate transport system permease component
LESGATRSRHRVRGAPLLDWGFTLNRYDEVLSRHNMDSTFVSSLVIIIPSTPLPRAIVALAAYAFSWIRFPFSRHDLAADRARSI